MQDITAPGAFVTPHSFFPFPEIRPAQQRALGAWNNAMAANKRFVVFELPTGSGKSPLAFSIGSWGGAKEFVGSDGECVEHGAYILTTQKSLQQQYLRDFAERGMVELKGAANYPCETHNSDCKTGSLMNRANKALLKAHEASKDSDPATIAFLRKTHPTGCGACPYQAAKAAFMEAPLGVTNFSYLLSEAAHAKRLKPRSLLIIDEAHNTESQLVSFVEIEITVRRCDEIGAPNPIRIQPGEVVRARAWALDEFLPKMKDHIKRLEMEVNNAEDSQVRTRLAARQAAAEQYVSRLKFLADAEELSDWFAYSDEKTGALKLRPLTAKSIAEDFLFRMGHKLLFLSATILDGRAFTRGLGLSGADGGFLRVDSDFPLENRLIHIYPAGSMSFKNIENTTPRLVRFIERILNKHGDEKGLIHTHSYKLTQAIIEHLQTTKHASRLIYHDATPGARDAAVVAHVTSLEPTVLISPSMTEGLDLAEDLSRFQIISKVPYPYLGDPFVKARMTHDNSWYTWQTALTIVQATGRSIRSKEDKATTYLLDSDFEAFMVRAEAILPEWWKKSLVYH